MTDSTSTAGEPGTQAPGQEAADAPETGAQAAQAPAAPAGTPDAAQAPAGEWDGKVESLPAGAQKIIRELRAESAEKRTKATVAEKAQQDAIRALAKAAGIELPDDAEDNTPDADKLARQLSDSQAAQRAAALELAAYRHAPKGVNVKALLDSRSFLASLADVDPTDTQAITAAINEAAKDARFRDAPAAPRAGGDLSGGTGEGTVTAERFARMSNAEKNALFKTDPDQFRKLAGI